MVIDSTGAIQGTADPTVIMIKGPDYATPPANTTLEVLSVVGVDAAPAADEPAADAPADEAPAADAPAADAPAADETPADTGIVLAVLPMAISRCCSCFQEKVIFLKQHKLTVKKLLA